MDRRIFGIETEFGVTCAFEGQRKLSPDEVARYLFRKVVSWGRSSNVFLRNGARLYLDVGVARDKGGCEASQGELREQMRRGDAQQSARCRAAVARGLECLGDFAHRAFGPPHQRVPGFRQHGALPAPFDETDAERVLQLGHPARQGRLGPATGATGLAEAAVRRDELEILQGIDIHGVPFSRQVVPILESVFPIRHPLSLTP